VVHGVVRWQRAHARAGTHAAKTRAEVSGSKKKPWKQKGTGRARAGAATSPLWVGGGVTFGPKPRSYGFRLNKRERRLALAAILSEKRRNGSLIIVDDLKLESGKTRDLAAALGNIGVQQKSAMLVLDSNEPQGKQSPLRRAGGNLAQISTLNSGGVNAYDLLKHNFVVGSKNSIVELQSRILAEQDQAQ
ncbi:MAG: 50S ribosomal protein L4, partial [Bdellovibrionales bacterium]|nr:50S ribosomal protein L4 [Bdellovibrionales bacterium]